MKKLMFAAAALVAGFAMADGIASANVVGYQDRAADKSGWNIVCGTFENVDGSEVTLADAKPNASFTWENPDTITFVSNGGATRIREDEYQAEYSYFTVEGEGAPADGWYQYSAATEAGEWLAPEEDDDFSYGNGAIIQTGSRSAGLIFNGQVGRGPQTILVAKGGWNLIGNPTPCSMTLSDVTPNASFTWENPDTITFITNGGATRVREDGYQAEYSYFTAEGEGAPADGWYQYSAATEGGEWLEPEVEDNEIAPGRCFVVQTGDRAAGLQFKQSLPLVD